MNLLFICYHNMARSQMAEGFASFYYPEHESRSAGVHVKESGDVVPRSVWNAMMERGIDLKNHRTAKLNPLMVDKADKIFVLCDKEDCPDYLINSGKIDYWKIDDPVKGYESMKMARDNIEERVEGIF